ncbi:pyridoxal phosphate-dependent aminotransferase [Photobacterium sanctipauli]|uniref:histidinol-phosphate transaminase n=1 Tax=Photobacterium sanctipauli TaxID=1342794 RepID=A0A2T3N7T4_9GAMM|nr:aminotransferase class I/II-fold pyridoxal phosphate-dependent enzyme [Photobacterium sanctipauli]PSW09158.1 pyridoxal phosphate-dependent aminotransferase [Photobacterium sanctipauli]
MKLNHELRQEQASYVSHSYIIDCALGSNPFGSPPIAAEFLPELLKDIDEYYSFEHLAELSHQVGQYLGVNSQDLTFTNGSLGALELIFNKLIDRQHRTMIGIGPQFVEAVSEFKLIGGHYEAIDMFEFNDERDLFGALINKIHCDKPAIVYIDNPNNPTGRIYDKENLIKLCQACEQSESLLIVDEAYGECLLDRQTMAQECKSFPNLVVVRTFSKGLGLAGLRLGYIVSSPTITPYLKEAVALFTPTLPAMKIASYILPNAKLFVRNNNQMITAYKQQMTAFLEKSGFEVLPSSKQTPIMLVRKSGDNASAYLKSIGVSSCCGTHFQSTSTRVNHEYARLRIVGNERNLEQLALRLHTNS